MKTDIDKVSFLLDDFFSDVFIDLQEIIHDELNNIESADEFRTLKIFLSERAIEYYVAGYIDNKKIFKINSSTKEIVKCQVLKGITPKLIEECFMDYFNSNCIENNEGINEKKMLLKVKPILKIIYILGICY